MPTAKEQAQGPGGYENFQQYFNANKGTTGQAVGRYSRQAMQGAENASGALGVAQRQFNTESQAGMVGAPTTNVGTNAAGYPNVNHRAGYTSTGAAANGQYTGPGSIADVSGFKNATQQANASDQQLTQLSGLVGQGGLGPDGQPRGDLSTLTAPNNATPGANNFSANLIGAAGNRQFSKLRAQFQPNKQLSNAVDASGKAAQKDIATSDANAQAARDQLNKPQPSAATPAPAGEQPTAINPLTDAQAYIDKYGYAAYSDAVSKAFGRQ